jgi:tetratricopeptide (TPR) repeat protein
MPDSRQSPPITPASPPSSASPSPVSVFDLERWQKAQQDLLKGRGDRALSTYRDLLKRFPNSEKLWFELGLAAAKELEFDEADRAFQRTAELSPTGISLRVLLGQQYHLLRRMDRARACFEQAVAMDPGSVHARVSLADWYEREHRLDDAWACIEAAAASHPANAQVNTFKALLLQRRGQRAEAEKLLREVIAAGSPDLNVKHSARHQLAMVLDETGQHAEALRWLAEAKTILRQSANIAKLEQSYDQADRRRRQLLADLTPEMIRRWRTEDTSAPHPRPAFLGGHPRSGTTLLEQILGAHPQITAFDEPVAFTLEILEQLAPLENAVTLTVNGLNQLSESRRSLFRQRYLKNLSRENRPLPDDGLFLDKNPSHTAALHLWLRLFPKVKVIIALRDPRDVIVSCYFQNLPLNATSANFLSLERTVKHYTDLMDVWLRLRELGGFDWIESRYEDVVENLEAEGQKVTQFLGLAWTPQQANFHEAARGKNVFAPNYNEVTRPVYRSAVGRWRYYAEALAPYQERLALYCRAFGYE